MICMSLDMICISKREINFHSFISLLTIADNLEQRVHRNLVPRSHSVLHSYKHAAPKKDDKANLFDQIILRFKLEALYSVK